MKSDAEGKVKPMRLVMVDASDYAELQRIVTLARIWSAYQDDDSKRDQQTDPGLKAAADNAERELFEALI